LFGIQALAQPAGSVMTSGVTAWNVVSRHGGFVAIRAQHRGWPDCRETPAAGTDTNHAASAQIEEQMTSVAYDYDGSQSSLQTGQGACPRRAAFATEADQQQARGGDGIERRQRERDNVISTLILAQGAAESYVNWVHITAGLTTKDSWIKRWENLPASAQVLRRPRSSALSDDHRDFLNRLGAWRNFLLHADSRARDRLRELLISGGDLTVGTSEPNLLTAALAETVLKQADEVFRWAQHLSGIQAPFLDYAWVALDEWTCEPDSTSTPGEDPLAEQSWAPATTPSLPSTAKHAPLVCGL
jgi:hypothetical protein